MRGLAFIRRTCLLAVLLIFVLSSLDAAFASEQSHDIDLVSRITLLIFQLSIIIFAAWTGGWVFRKFKLPKVLGEIVSGVIVGPYLLGAISIPGFVQGVFPMHPGFPVSPELYSIATIASIVLLFLAGVETDINTFLRYSFVGSVVGISGVIFSFVLGDITGIVLSEALFGRQYGFASPVPLFLGAICTATSVGIGARILSDKRKMDSPEGITIISAAVIDDILGVITLAIVIGIARSSDVNWAQVSIIAGKGITIWFAFTALGIVFAPKISNFLKIFKDRGTISIMSFAMALFLAGVFEKSGLAMIIGAYTMGLSLSRTDLCFIIRENLSILYKFFVPVFFCVMGMMVDIKEVCSPSILLFGAVYLVVAILSKLIGCGLPARLLNFNTRGALAIGVGMVPRGEVALIIAGIGLSLGVIPHDIFSVAVLMTFITTLITPPVLEMLVDTDKSMLVKQTDRRLEHKEISYAMPNPETADLILSRVINAFDHEGFFIYRIDTPERLYQIRKDETFITLKFTSEKLYFTCQPQDASFVYTLFYEVIAEFEYIIKNLDSIADKDQVGKDIISSGNGAKKEGLAIREIIPLSAVEHNLTGNTKEEIISSLVELLIRSGQLHSSNKQEIIRELSDREEIISTGMQDGIALPHAKTRLVKNMISALGINREGVVFGSLDKKPSRVFVVTIAPESFSSPYLQYVAEVSKFLIKPENRLRLLSAKNNEELYNIILNYK
ncbi:MAG: cation:proton antiporter [Candidatus Omnitrophota bacterium]|jgi:Kef-type K+ transport system membrane component KefB/mannitol/fructose-specific phosphotransferase system IIA component (Ntr-type)